MEMKYVTEVMNLLKPLASECILKMKTRPKSRANFFCLFSRKINILISMLF